MSHYLHDLANDYRHGDAHPDRRRDEWADMRTMIDGELDNLPPYMQIVFLRGFRLGYARAAAMAVPREQS